MIDRFDKYPDIPDGLKVAAHRKSLVPFIGAGVSRIIGYPNWEEFAVKALKFFVTERKLNHAQFDQILDRKLSPRIILSLAKNLEEKFRLPIEFEKILSPQEGWDPNYENIYEDVIRLFQFSKTFVTTNFDKELDGQLRQGLPEIDEKNTSVNAPLHSVTPIYEPKDIDVRSLDKKNSVIHIHGSVRDRNSMVLTTSDYLERYSGHKIDGPAVIENPFLSFLQQLFVSRNVLFIGYGLEELEILEYVFHKSSISQPKDAQGRIEEKHYIIQGYYSHQLELANSLASYFHSLGIKLLPFSLDTDGWDGLGAVIHHLIDTLPPGEDLTLEARREMAELLPS